MGHFPGTARPFQMTMENIRLLQEVEFLTFMALVGPMQKKGLG